MRILVCDDNRDFCNTLALLLESEGHETVACYDGSGCIAKARDWQPQIALIDIGLPDMPGYYVAAAIRHMRFGRDAFLVAVTGYAQFDDVKRAKAAGFDVHVKKGSDAKVLVELVERLDADRK